MGTKSELGDGKGTRKFVSYKRIAQRGHTWRIEGKVLYRA